MSISLQGTRIIAAVGAEAGDDPTNGLVGKTLPIRNGASLELFLHVDTAGSLTVLDLQIYFTHEETPSAFTGVEDATWHLHRLWSTNASTTPNEAVYRWDSPQDGESRIFYLPCQGTHIAFSFHESDTGSGSGTGSTINAEILVNKRLRSEDPRGLTPGAFIYSDLSQVLTPNANGFTADSQGLATVAITEEEYIWPDGGVGKAYTATFSGGLVQTDPVNGARLNFLMRDWNNDVNGGATTAFRTETKILTQPAGSSGLVIAVGLVVTNVWAYGAVARDAANPKARSGFAGAFTLGAVAVNADGFKNYLTFLGRQSGSTNPGFIYDSGTAMSLAELRTTGFAQRVINTLFSSTGTDMQYGISIYGTKAIASPQTIKWATRMVAIHAADGFLI